MAEAALEYIRGQVTESPKQINLEFATGTVVPTLLRRLLEEDLSFSTCEDRQNTPPVAAAAVELRRYTTTQRTPKGTLPGSTPARLSTGGRYAAQ